MAADEREERKRRRMRWFVWAIVILTAASYASWYGRRYPDKPPTKYEPPYPKYVPP